jgi:drug/metabolite transporter (DMT)-like permease
MELRYFLMGVICSFLASTSQLIFKKSVSSLRVNSDFSFSLVVEIIKQKAFYFLMFAFVIYFLGSLIWLYLLKKIELSEAVSFMILSFVLTFIWSVIFLNEIITIKKMIGILLAIFGILLITF